MRVYTQLVILQNEFLCAKSCRDICLRMSDAFNKIFFFMAWLECEDFCLQRLSTKRNDHNYFNIEEKLEFKML